MSDDKTCGHAILFIEARVNLDCIGCSVKVGSAGAVWTPVDVEQTREMLTSLTSRASDANHTVNK